MIGLIILVIAAIYLALLAWATRAAYVWAKKRGLAMSKCWFAAAGGFFLIYLPVFWDHIPTLIAHKYYCEKEAGFWVYKTAEQWKKENPGVAETLTWRQLSQPTEGAADKDYTVYLNERFISQIKYRRFLIPVTVATESVIDRKTGEVLAKHVGVGTGYGNMMVGSDWRSMKFWLRQGPCDGESMPSRGQYEQFALAVKTLGEKR